MRAIGQNTPAETIVNLGRKYQGERPFRHPKADLVRKVLLKAAISFQSRRPNRGEALQFTQYRFTDRTESLRSALRKTNLTPAQHRFWRSATYTVLTAKTTEPNPRRQRCIEFLCQRSIESIVNGASNRTGAHPYYLLGITPSPGRIINIWKRHRLMPVRT